MACNDVAILPFEPPHISFRHATSTGTPRRLFSKYSMDLRTQITSVPLYARLIAPFLVHACSSLQGNRRCLFHALRSVKCQARVTKSSAARRTRLNGQLSLGTAKVSVLASAATGLLSYSFHVDGNGFQLGRTTFHGRGSGREVTVTCRRTLPEP